MDRGRTYDADGGVGVLDLEIRPGEAPVAPADLAEIHPAVEPDREVAQQGLTPSELVDVLLGNDHNGNDFTAAQTLGPTDPDPEPSTDVQPEVRRAVPTSYKIVTERILEQLDKGVIPWRRPWNIDPPKNVEGRPYSGVNFFLLATSGFGNPYWLTAKAVAKHGGTIKETEKEKGTTVVWWNMREYPDKKAELDENGNPRLDEDGEPIKRMKTLPTLKCYTVYNVEQCENLNLKPEILNPPMLNNRLDPIVAAERIWDGYADRPPLKFGGAMAFYQSSTDTIQMPVQGSFQTSEDYYAVLLHEAAHSTGHPSRLDRKLGASMGSKDRAREELVAELASAFLYSEAHLESTHNGALIENTAAYIDSWRQKLKDDPKCFVIAAARAQKAADYILGRKKEPGGRDAAKEEHD